MKRLLTLCLVFCLMLNNTIAYAAKIPEQTHNLPSQCENITEATLRKNLEIDIQDFLIDQPNVNFDGIVARQWKILNLDEVIDFEIHKAALSVNNDTGIINRFGSSWVPGKAEELANKVTDIAFKSQSLKVKLNQLSNNVSKMIASQMEIVSAKSSSYAMDCLRRFVGTKYSETFVDVFSNKVQVSELSSDNMDSLNPNTTSYIDNYKSGLVGGGILATTAIVRKKVTGKIIDRVFQQVGERVLGRLGSGLIPVVGDIVGATLLATDVIKSFEGALPEIEKSLKSPTVKKTIQKEIVRMVEEEVRPKNSQIAREISNHIYSVWLEVRKDYQEVLKLEAEEPEFKEAIKNEADLSKISSIVGVIINKIGRDSLITSIKDGTFERVISLPEVSYKIIETTRELSTLVEWANLADNRIHEVVSLELYKHLSPKDLDRQLLSSILDIKDSSTTSKIILLDINSIRKLLSISTQNLVALSVNLSSGDLKRLAGYLEDMEQPQKNQLVRFLINDDSSIIKNNSVMTYVVQSCEIDTAIKFWEEKESPLLLIDGIFKMARGAISWELIAEKFGIPMSLFFISIPIILLISLFLIIGHWFYRQHLKTNQTQKTVGELNAN
jgi:hypothetical protein